MRAAPLAAVFLFLWTAVCLPASPAAPIPSNRETELKSVHDDVMRQIRAQESEYERAQEKLKATKKGAADLAKKERGLLKQLESAERTLTNTRAELTALTQNLEILQADLRSTQGRWASEHESQEHRRRLLASRIRAMYVVSARADPARDMVMVGDGSNRILSRESLYHVAGADRNLIREIGERKAALEKVETLLEEKQVRLRAVQDEKRAVEKRQEKERARRERILTDVRSRRSGLEEQARQLGESSENLKRLLTALREQSLKLREQLAYLRKDFEDRKGLLQWPMASSTIRGVQPFGKVFDESIQNWRLNKGIDILTENNQSVLAVSKGEVVFADFFGRMGNLVILSHGGDYFTLYAHLSEINVKLGDQLEAGAALGRSGNTGLLEDQAILHFEIRQGSQAVDPDPWLGRR